MQNKQQIIKTSLLGFLGILMLSFPFISIPNKIALIFSVPVLYIYVFGIWLVLIILVFVLIEKPKPKNKPRNP